jgi:hypothetical protein
MNYYFSAALVFTAFVSTGCLKKNTGSSTKDAEISINKLNNTATLKVELSSALDNFSIISKVKVKHAPEGLEELNGVEFYSAGVFPPKPDSNDPSSQGGSVARANEPGGKGGTIASDNNDPDGRGGSIPGDPSGQGGSRFSEPDGKGGTIAYATNDPNGQGGSIALVAGDKFFVVQNIPLSLLPKKLVDKLTGSEDIVALASPAKQELVLSTEVLLSAESGLSLSGSSSAVKVIESKGELRK